jgi:hypothetical protein
MHEQNTAHSLVATPDVEKNTCRINVMSEFLFIRPAWILYVFQFFFVRGICMRLIA